MKYLDCIDIQYNHKKALDSRLRGNDAKKCVESTLYRSALQQQDLSFPRRRESSVF